MKKYYKVVTEDLRSYLCGENPNFPYFVQYKLNKWAGPTLKDSKLFVFSSLRAAKKWVHNYTCKKGFPRCKTVIYECKVKNPSIPKYIQEIGIGNLLEYIALFWKIRKNKKSLTKHTYCRTISYVSNAIVFCDAIKLIGKINI